MTAVPGVPGAAAPSYQPARFWISCGGASIQPSGSSPTLVSGASTAMDGIDTQVGTAGGSGWACDPGDGWSASAGSCRALSGWGGADGPSSSAAMTVTPRAMTPAIAA